MILTARDSAVMELQGLIMFSITSAMAAAMGFGHIMEPKTEFLGVTRYHFLDNPNWYYKISPTHLVCLSIFFVWNSIFFACWQSKQLGSKEIYTMKNQMTRICADIGTSVYGLILILFFVEMSDNPQVKQLGLFSLNIMSFGQFGGNINKPSTQGVSSGVILTISHGIGMFILSINRLFTNTVFLIWAIKNRNRSTNEQNIKIRANGKQSKSQT